jgi:hypothetical protein
MKNAKRLIPTPPTPPTPPEASIGAEILSGEALKGSSPVSPLQGMLAQLMKGAGAGVPDGKVSMIEGIMKKIGGGKGPSTETIKRWIKEFPLDKYRDANGKVCCPVPKEVRDKLMKRLKG